MNYKILGTFLLFALLFSSCSDSELDPLQVDKLKKGSILGLRGGSVANLSNASFITGVDTFNVLQDNSQRNFSFTCDFISEVQSDLSSVDTYVINKDGARVKVKSTPASEFVPADGTNFNRATITVPFTDLLNASGKSICDFKPSNAKLGVFSFIDIENDINLTDGTIVPASSVVNSSLFESTIFYPAHKLRMIAKGPAVENVKVDLSSKSSLTVDFNKLVTQADPGTTYTWTSEGNPNVTGVTSPGSGTSITDKLTNTSAKKQVVVYNVVPTLSNGCEGAPFTVTVSVVLKEPCVSELGGTYAYSSTGWCGTVVEGTIEFRAEENGVYQIYLDGGADPDFSMGAYAACYGADVTLPGGDLKLIEDCNFLSFTGASRWGETYVFNKVTVAGKTLTLDWKNDYDPEAGVIVITRTDKDWPPYFN